MRRFVVIMVLMWLFPVGLAVAQNDTLIMFSDESDSIGPKAESLLYHPDEWVSRGSPGFPKSVTTAKQLQAKGWNLIQIIPAGKNQAFWVFVK